MTLKHLQIKNLILVDQATVPFESGFNLISGETGSGKSALLHALSLIAGERAESSMIRHEAEKASVEAVFEIDHLPRLIALLQESGIDHVQGEELVIRREILASGKSRALINQQTVNITFLKQMSQELLEIVGQHANQKLFSTDSHRRLVDIFGDLQETVSAFSASWAEENMLQKQLELLVNSESQRLRDSDRYQAESEELAAADLKEGEEEELFAEYSRLSHTETLLKKSEEILQSLVIEKFAVLPALHRQKQTFQQLIQIDPTLEETYKAYDNCALELHEIVHTLRNYHSRLSHDPERVSFLSDRLNLITRLKKRYGNSITEIHLYFAAISEKLQQLNNSDAKIDRLKAELELLEKDNNKKAEELTQKRKKAATSLEKALTQELRSLNMPKAAFECRVSAQKRSQFGDDQIEFYIQPNAGEPFVAVRDCASGGEISRLLLSIQTLLAGKEETPILVFDEIDANIGGATAAIVGEKLKAIGQKHQLLCITHFPQVAKFAQHHLAISKEESDGRTFTRITVLDSKARKKELLRMEGN